MSNPTLPLFPPEQHYRAFAPNPFYPEQNNWGFEPFNIMAYAAGPAVLKTADFPGVSPYNLVSAVAEKRRVKADKVYALRIQGFEDFKIVPKDKAVNGHILNIHTLPKDV
jgi:hypothetical protein